MYFVLRYNTRCQWRRWPAERSLLALPHPYGRLVSCRFSGTILPGTATCGTMDRFLRAKHYTTLSWHSRDCRGRHRCAKSVSFSEAWNYRAHIWCRLVALRIFQLICHHYGFFDHLVSVPPSECTTLYPFMDQGCQRFYLISPWMENGNLVQYLRRYLEVLATMPRAIRR